MAIGHLYISPYSGKTDGACYRGKDSRQSPVPYRSTYASLGSVRNVPSAFHVTDIKSRIAANETLSVSRVSRFGRDLTGARTLAPAAQTAPATVLATEVQTASTTVSAIAIQPVSTTATQAVSKRQSLRLEAGEVGSSYATIRKMVKWINAGYDAAVPQRDLDDKSDRGLESGSDSGVASDDEASDSDSAFVEESDQDVGATHYPSDAGNTLSLEDDGFALPPSPSPTHNDIGFWASRNTLPLSVEIENADHLDRFDIDEKEMSAKIDNYCEENESIDGAEHESAAIADIHRISVPASNAPAAVRLDEQHQEWEGTLSRLSDEMTAIDVSKDWVLPYRGANHLKLMCVSGAPDRLSEFYDADPIGLAQRLDALQRKSDALTALISECGEVEETIRAAKGGGDMTPASLQLLDRYRKLRETWQCTMNAYYGAALNLGKMRLAAEQVQQIAVRYADALWRDSATVASRANTIVRVEDMSEEACSAFCFHYLTNDALDHAVGGLSSHIFTPSPQRGDYPVVQSAPSDLERFSAQWARDRDSLIALRPAFASIPNGEFANECTRLIGSLTVAVEKARGALAALG